MDELKQIFEEQGESMEWKRVVKEVAQDIAADKPVESMCSPATGTFTDLLRCVVQRSIVEIGNTWCSKEVQRTQQKFCGSVKEENREMDEKNINEKRTQKSPKEKTYQKKRKVESNENWS